MKLKTYNIKVVISMDIVAENGSEAMDCIDEMEYNFLETTGKAAIDRYEIIDAEIMDERD